MIEPDPLEVAGWQLVAGVLRSESLPDLATAALMRGTDSPSLRELAGQNPADVRDSADLFRLALAELGLRPPDLDGALWSLVRTVAQGISDGGVPPAAGANQICGLAYHRVEHSGDLRIFVGLTSVLDDHPEQRAEIEAHILAAATELLRRPHPRRWIKLMAVAGHSPLSRTAGNHALEVDAESLPIGPRLVADVAAWAADHASVLADWPHAGGFASEKQAEEFVDRGQQLVARLQDELGPDYQVEYLPEPIRPPGVKLHHLP